MSEQVLNHSAEETQSRTLLHLVGGLVVVALVTLGMVSCKRLQAEPPFECTDAIGCVTIAPGEPLKLGAIHALSGPGAFLGKDQDRGVELALDKQDHQFLGHPIELQSEDGACTPEGGANAALKIVADPQVVAVVGTSCSGSGVTASKITSEAGLIMVSGSNTAASLTSIGDEPGADWYPGYYRTTANDVLPSQATAVFVYQELGMTKVATIDDGETFAQEFTKAFGQRFTELGGEVVLDGEIRRGDTNMKPILEAVILEEAELIFLPVEYDEAILIIHQARDMPALDNVVLVTRGFVQDPDVFDAIKQKGIGSYFISEAILEEGPGVAQVNADYEAKYGTTAPPAEILCLTYDATLLILDSLEAVAVQEQDGTLHIGRQALRQQMSSTSGYEGVTGTLTCSKYGDCASGVVYILRLDDPAAGIDGLRKNVIYTYPGTELE